MSAEQSQTPATPVAPTFGNDQTNRAPDGTIQSPGQPQQTAPTNPPDPTSTPNQNPTDTQTKTENAPPVVPDKYEFKVPEGLPESVQLDQAQIEAVTPVLKELGLNQEQAQKLMDFHMKALQGHHNQFMETVQGWQKEVLNDNALGNGTALKPEVEGAIGRLIDSLGAEQATAFRQAMAVTGAGSHPAVVRAVYALAQRTGEGTVVTGKGPSPAAQGKPTGNPGPATALWGHLPQA